MSAKKLEGHGRLVSTRSTSIAYQVRYGIHIVGDTAKPARGIVKATWTKCSVYLADAGQVPDGSYFLYTDDGKVYQVKSSDGKWNYLALAA